MASDTDPGPGVDAQGRPVIDPTANVIAILEAAVKRQDDLREAESRHMRELSELRARYDGLLRQAESQRIDAIRAVDIGAVNRAAEVSTTQAATLAAQVATTAETLRTTLGTALEPIQKDIADLRRAQYEAQGQKTQVVETRSGASNNILFAGVILSALFGIVSLVITIALRG